MKAKIAALAAVAGVAVAAACAAAWSRGKSEDDWTLEPARSAGAGGAAPPSGVATIPVEPAAVEPAAVEPVPTDGAGTDDLTAVKGIGPVYVERLAEAGVTTLAQIASWSEDDIDSIGPSIKADPNRIRREDWVGQARRLAGG